MPNETQIHVLFVKPEEYKDLIIFKEGEKGESLISLFPFGMWIYGNENFTKIYLITDKEIKTDRS